MLNLLHKLTEEDNTKITNYIGEWGVESGYKGNEDYLSDWAASKKTLYHLLSGQLIYKEPIEIEKDKEIYEKEISLLLGKTDFLLHLRQALENVQTGLRDIISLSTDCFVSNSYSNTLKFKLTEDSKLLQIPKGTKIMKAIQKIIKYFNFTELEDEFEKLRIAHSMILNDKTIKGNLCFSIHPLDFITMSDNNSNWVSCMSWKENGCYHEGTVEMMNSNNVICCYLESNVKYNFSRNNRYSDNADYEWNNKRWRQLVYVTKDIIACGKAYPYQSEPLSKKILSILKSLSIKNLHQNYKYGPELYQDMKHISYNSEMDKNREWLKWSNTMKKNIIFDTKGMYNDFFNDKKTPYWCIRNKTDKPKIICVSGKAKCLCCNNDVIYDNDEYEYDNEYNERYANCRNVLCDSCSYDRTCYHCDSESSYYDLIEYNNDYYCTECYNQLRICPSCGEVAIIEDHDRSKRFFCEVKGTELTDEEKTEILKNYDSDENYYSDLLKKCYCCGECIYKLRNEKLDQYKYKEWRYASILKYKIEDDEFDDYIFENLKLVKDMN